MITAQRLLGLPRALSAAAVVAIAVALAACSGPAPRKSGGGYFKDDGPGSNEPADLAAIPDAKPRREALLARANKPYVVFGKQYVPMTGLDDYQQTGVASWYGRKFHGQRTSSGEFYDMYGMTAAHPTLPIPSYVRVTSLRNGRSVVVRVNDRGPFLQDRLIDLSWTAAAKLGYVNAGFTQVRVELVTRFDGDDGMPVAPPANVAMAPVVPVTGTGTGVPGASGSAAVLPIAPIPVAAATVVTALPAVSVAPVTSTSITSGPADARVAAGTDRGQEVAESSLAVTPVAAVVPLAGDAATATPTAAAMSTATALAPASTAQPATENSEAPSSSPASLQASTPRAGSLYLQLAAFSSIANAQASRELAERRLERSNVRLDIHHDGAFFKLQAGPFQRREDADEAARQIRSSTDYRPFATVRVAQP